MAEALGAPTRQAQLASRATQQYTPPTQFVLRDSPPLGVA